MENIYALGHPLHKLDYYSGSYPYRIMERLNANLSIDKDAEDWIFEHSNSEGKYRMVDYILDFSKFMKQYIVDEGSLGLVSVFAFDKQQIFESSGEAKTIYEIRDVIRRI